MSEDTDWSDYESGPFCRHWAEPWECDEACACGHPCKAHRSWGEAGECEEAGCQCQGFNDPAESISERAAREAGIE